MRGRFAILDLHGCKVATTLVDSVPGAHGGPWAMADGRLVARDDEAAVDEVLADRHDLVAASSLVLAACGDDDDTSTDMPMSDSGMDGTMGGGMGNGGAMGHDETSPVADGARRVEVTARSFEFIPAEISVTAGEDVAIVLTSEDLLHDFLARLVGISGDVGVELVDGEAGSAPTSRAATPSTAPWKATERPAWKAP